MTSSLRNSITIFALLLVLVAVNWSVFGKERIKLTGEVVYLKLAPVDPRSLMQGDYMALRFEIAQGLDTAASGRLPLHLDERRVGTLATGATLSDLRMKYRIRNSQVWLGTNAYFFEEGSAARYSGAAYGEFRVDRDSGEGVLVGLRDAALKPL